MKFSSKRKKNTKEKKTNKLTNKTLLKTYIQPHANDLGDDHLYTKVQCQHVTEAFKEV